MTTSTPPRARATGAVPRAVFHSAWILPVLVVGQFALVGVVPATLIAVGALRRIKDRTLRRLALLVTASYAAPLLVWALDPARARSLSRDIDPAFVVLIVAFSAAFLIQALRARSH